MVEVRQRDNMFVGFDDTYLPLLISTFRGSLDMDAARWHDEVTTRVIRQCFANGRRPLHVVDARQADVPSAQLRKFWALRISQSVSTLQSMLGVVVVMDNAALRGALTAINWICPEAHRVEYLPTLRDALNLVKVRFAASGYPLLDLDAECYDPTAEAAPAESYQAIKAGVLPSALSMRAANR